MTRKQKRLSVIAGALGFLGLATFLTFYALGQKASYFYMPADLAENHVADGQRIRLGGLVAKGSISRGAGTEVDFAVTDQAKHDETYMPKEVADSLKAKGVWNGN